ncbi:hypothetical protein LKL48_15360, partial [Listeria monocytogenes]|nr:hypothetical protein [Listeria monocytogenes]
MCIRYRYPRDWFSARRGYGGSIQLFGCFAGWSECCLCHCAVSYTHLTLPTILRVLIWGARGNT